MGAKDSNLDVKATLAAIGYHPEQGIGTWVELGEAKGLIGAENWSNVVASLRGSQQDIEDAVEYLVTMLDADLTPGELATVTGELVAMATGTTLTLSVHWHHGDHGVDAEEDIDADDLLACVSVGYPQLTGDALAVALSVTTCAPARYGVGQGLIALLG